MINFLYLVSFVLLISSDNFPGYDAEPIQGGQPDQGNEAIWLTSYQKKQVDGTWRHVCGGSIVSDKHVVTAAHCFVRFGESETQVWDRRGKSRIVIGTNDLNSIANSGFRLKIEKVIIPKAYTKLGKTPFADIAVIKVKHRIDLSRNIGKYGLIDLFDPKDETEKTKYNDQEGFVAGFGATGAIFGQDGKKTYISDRIRNILSVQLTNHRCSQIRGTICVEYVKGGEEPRGVCCGDSGGPLYYRNGNKFELVGVISTGPRNCDIRTSRHKVAKVTFIPDYKDFLDKARTLNFHMPFPEMSVEDFEELGVDYIVLPDQAELARSYYVQPMKNKEKKKPCSH